MNPYIKICLLLLINYYSFTLAGIWFGILSLSLTIYKILSLLGLTKSPIINLSHFDDGITYTKDYLGAYSKQKEAFTEATKLIETFKLQDYVIIALYYDYPGSVEESQLRSSIGIYKKKGFENKESEDFEKYCEQNGYNKNELPSCKALFSHWDFLNFAAMIIGIQKFYKLIEKNLDNTEYRKKYRIDKSKITAFLEVYETMNSMSFYVPIENEEKFMIYKKEK
jgi:hypothetical protein